MRSMVSWTALALGLALASCTTPLPLVQDAGAMIDAGARLDVPAGLDAETADVPEVADAAPTTDAPRAPFEGCPADALRVDDAWGATITTSDYGGFGDNILAVRLVPDGGGSGNATSTWVEYVAASTVREAVMSTHACDFSAANALRTETGSPAISRDTISPGFIYRLGAPSRDAFGLELGREYYINIRNRWSDGSSSCPDRDCVMRGAVRVP